jgi:prepilin-type N-terminal cleavage/methylation domain-containing protein
MAPKINRRPGFTLVEILAVIAVLAVLLALLFPAVQRVREASYRTQCLNNVKQIALGCLAHVDQHGWFPSAGWGWGWIGCPHRGTGPDQPGGWAYNILPYIEQADLRKLGYGKSGAAFISDMQALVTKPVAIYNCPSRRPAKTYVCYYGFYSADSAGGTPTFNPPQVVRADYAGNAGSYNEDERGPGPSSTTDGDRLSWWQSTAPYNALPMPNGIFFQRSKVLKGDVTRGLSNVYMVGERYLNTDHYYNANDPADNETFYAGYNNDICRSTVGPPRRDRPLFTDTFAFGSAHVAGFHMSYCDGSVRFIGYDVNANVHRLSGVRFEQNP